MNEHRGSAGLVGVARAANRAKALGCYGPAGHVLCFLGLLTLTDIR